MEKTTVYLSEEQVSALRRASRVTGRSQSELIREGVDRVTGDQPPRTFRSMGIVRSSGGHDVDLDAEITTVLEDRLRADRDRPAEGAPA